MPIESVISPKLQLDRSSDTSPDALTTLAGLVDADKEKDKRLTNNQIELGFERKIPNLAQKEILRHYILNAEQVLTDMGIPNPSELLPNVNDIAIFTSERLEGNAGISISPVGAIRVFLEQGTSFTDPIVEGLVYHESAHHIRRTVMHLEYSDDGKPKVDQVSVGFLRTRLKYGSTERKGVFEEALANLFEMECFDYAYPFEKTTCTATYMEQTALVMAFLIKDAQLSGKTPKEAYHEAFRAQIQQDYSYFGRVIEHFSNLGIDNDSGLSGKQRATDMVRTLNNITTSLKEGLTNDGLQGMTKAIDLGDLSEIYNEIKAALSYGSSVAFPGINTRLVMEQSYSHL